MTSTDMACQHLRQIADVADSHSLELDTCQVWLFGSYIWSAVPRDLDFLIVYEEESVDFRTIRSRVADFAAQISSLVDLPVHLTILSACEEAEDQFASKVSAVRIL